MPLTPIKQPRFNMDLRTQGYVFTVALFAAIFIGLFLFRPRGAVRVAETQVKYDFTQLTTDRGVPIDPQATSVVAEHMLAEVTSREFLAPVISRVGLVETPDGAVVEQWARRISIDIQPSGENSLLLAMRCESSDPTTALSFADGMASQFVERHNRAAVVESVHPPVASQPAPAATERDFAATTVKQWEQRVSGLTADQQSFVQRQLSQMESQHRAGEDYSDNPLDRVAPKPAQAFIRLPQANPHWIKLQIELKNAQRKIEVMLETYTPAHPAMLQMFSEVEAIRQELGRTSRTVDGQVNPNRAADHFARATEQPSANDSNGEVANNPMPVNVNRDGQFNQSPPGNADSKFNLEPPTASVADGESSAANDLQPPASSIVQASPADNGDRVSTENAPRVAAAEFDSAEALLTIKASTEYRQFAAKLRAANDKLAQARQHLASIPVAEAKSPVVEVVVTSKPESSSVIAPARITTVLRPPFTSTSALQLFGPATLFAFVLSIGRRPTRLPGFLCSEEDVANTLGLPIVSGVSQPKGPIFEMPDNKTPRWVVVGIRMCEAIAVICVMLIVMGLVTQPDFAYHMTSNPFDAFCIGLDQLQAFFARLLT